MDVALLIFLIFLNALFAMSEMALTASRKARLQVMVETGDAGAKVAMALHEDPTKFLSVVQIGITSIGVLNGIVGEAAFSAPFAAWLSLTFGLQPQAAGISATAMVVIVITFVTIIFGELVPKRLGQMYPESVARLVAQPMEWLSILTRPFVALLSVCTQGTLRLLGITGGPSRSVTEEEIAAASKRGSTPA
jgi:putative hemolysin